MNKLLWVLQILLTLAMGLFGAQKVFMPIPDLIEFGMLWIEDFPAWQVRTIGTLEVLGAIGLNAPYLIKALPKLLTPVAAAGLAMTMVGAVATHVIRGDPAASIIITTLLFAISVTLTIKRFGQIRAAQ